MNDIKDPVVDPASPSETSSPGLMKRPTAAPIKRPRKDLLWTLITKSIGGRDGFVAAAALSSNPKADDLLNLLADPAYSTWGVKKLAKKAGLKPAEIIDMFREQKWLQTTIAIHQELPEIIRDAVQDARASSVPCPDCLGMGLKKDGIKCKMCNEGRVRKPGDNAKLAFVGEAAGITGKKGPLVQVNQQFNQTGLGEESFNELMRRSSPRMRVQNRVIDEPDPV